SNCATVKAGGFKTGFLDSAVAKVYYGSTPIMGTGTGLTGTYFSTPNLTSPVLTRLDPTINLSLQGSPPPAPAPGMSPYFWSTRWQGYIEPEYTDTYVI